MEESWQATLRFSKVASGKDEDRARIFILPRKESFRNRNIPVRATARFGIGELPGTLQSVRDPALLKRKGQEPNIYWHLPHASAWKGWTLVAGNLDGEIRRHSPDVSRITPGSHEVWRPHNVRRRRKGNGRRAFV